MHFIQSERHGRTYSVFVIHQDPLHFEKVPWTCLCFRLSKWCFQHLRVPAVINPASLRYNIRPNLDSGRVYDDHWHHQCCLDRNLRLKNPQIPKSVHNFGISGSCSNHRFCLHSLLCGIILLVTHHHYSPGSAVHSHHAIIFRLWL